jgi:TolB-like protein
LASLERDRVSPARPVPTGYADLDWLLCGGLPSGCAVALTSPSCNERDLLVKSFLETGAKKGEAAFYVTINPGSAKALADEYKSSFWLFVCNPQADAIVRDAPNVVKLKGVENLTDISIALTSAIRKLDPSLRGDRRICLGLVSDILLQHHAIQTRRWLAGLIPELQSEGFTTLALIEPQVHPSEELNAILGLFEGEINIYEKETERGLERYLRIRKMGNQQYLKDEVARAPTTEQADLDKRRIAVLPFVNMSPDPNDEYFADGMTEEIISTVSGISGLNVISRTSVMGYKGTTKKIEEIGRELKVGSVLEGSFRKAGSKIRITTQLIDVGADRHLWAQNYDRNLDDVFAVQSDVAKQVAEALRVRILSPERERLEKKPTESTKAYTLYLKGRHLWNKRGLDDLKKARECFEQAVKEDPSFALGYVGQADSCLILRENWGEEPEANLERGQRAVIKALELDPGLAEAHATRGLLLEQEYKPKPAEEEYKRAIELKPGYSFAHLWYSQLLYCQLRWDEAFEQIEKALELDPLSPRIIFNHGLLFAWKRDYPRALEILKRAAELGDPLAHDWLAVVYGLMQMYDDMKREMAVREEILRDSVPLVRVGNEGLVAYLEGDKETLRRLLPQFEAQPHETSWGAMEIALAHFLLGENDEGFKWLERSYSRRESRLLLIKCSPFAAKALDNVRTDPRYLDLLKRLGLDQTAQPTS